MSRFSPFPPAEKEWVLQPDAVISENNPGSGTIYPVLPLTEDGVKIHSVVLQVAWTAQPSPLEAHLLIDGIPVIHLITNPVTATPYGLCSNQSLDYTAMISQYLIATYSATYLKKEYEGRAISVSAEITGGTVSNLGCRVKWSRRV